MINQAVFILQEGRASSEDVEVGMRRSCNDPIGPLAVAVADLVGLVGLETLLAVLSVFYEGFNDLKYRPAPLLKELVAAGRSGRNSGQGFYVY